MDSKSKPAFTEADIKAVLSSQEGQRLFQMLKKESGNQLNRAAAAIQAGEYEKAYELLNPIMNTPNAAQLLKEINKKSG